jgi:chemotaxis protein methyltransferase CheR
MRSGDGQAARAGLEIARAQARQMTLILRTLESANILARAIVNTLPEPFLVLDAELRVLEASRAFYETFRVAPEQTMGCLLYALGDGQWDIPALRTLLETIIPDKVAMDGFEVEHDFPGIGCKTMLLNARKVLYAASNDVTILLAFHDVTIRRAIEREKEEILRETAELLQQKRVLLEEMRHRVANSLQIIASILLLKARAVSSDEIRFHLKDAHQRVMSVAAVQQHLHATDGIDQINVSSYFRKLCTGLADSMVGESQPVLIDVASDDGMVLSAEAVSLGLIVTELVINALKYAFPAYKADAAIRIAYEIDGADWRLTVSDNGVGAIVAGPPKTDSGLGTTIIEALAKQLGAKVDVHNSATGMSVAITRATFTSRTPGAIAA